MPGYKIITLVDITRTNCSRDEQDIIRQGQQANFNSLIQTIGLRSNLEWSTDPEMIVGSNPNYFPGKLAYWEWQFFVEQQAVFDKDGDPVGHLLDDLHGVPIVDGLTETVNLAPSAIQTRGQNINLWAVHIV